MNVIGVANIAPAILEVGTQEQKDRFLAPMLRGDEIWCQGMSEPDAGSDLASLRTSAAVDGDEFVINGQKTWNSLGHHADWCQLYVRTDPSAPKHAGISCLLVDMRSPGIEVRPLRTMTGEVMFSELFFTDVRVPTTSLLGPLNEGWKVAMTTLSFERAGVAKFHLSLSARFADLVEETRRSGIEVSPVQRDRLIQLYSRIACLRWSTARELEVVGRGGRPSAANGESGQTDVGRHLPGAGRAGPRPARPRGPGGPVVEEPARLPRVVDRRRHHRDQPEYRGRTRSGASPLTTTARNESGEPI